MLQQPRHAELTLRIDEPHLVSPLLTLLVISISPLSPSSILYLLISTHSLIPFISSLVCMLSFFVTLHLYPTSASLLIFVFSPFFLMCLLTTHSVCQNQTRERRKCHTNNVRVSISVSCGDTFINERSTRPCRCSITFAGACPRGAQHVRCVSECVCVHECIFVCYCLYGSCSQVYVGASWSGQQH